MVRTRLVPLSLVLLVCFSLVACGGSQKKTTVTATPISAQSILSQAAQRWDQTNSLHFVLQIDGVVALDQNGTIRLRGAEGDILRPDRAQAKTNVSFGGANLSVTLMSVGQDQYITNFLTGAWEHAPANLGYNPAVLFDKDKGISAILTRIENPELVGTETVEGVKARHIRGSASQSTVQELTGGALNADKVDFDLWINEANSDLLKVVFRGPTTTGGNTPTTWTLLMSKHNAPVTIEPPKL